MSATHCLGPFAEKLRATPMTRWKVEIDKLPEICPHGCGVDCRTYCAAYARVQWKIAKLRESKGARA